MLKYPLAINKQGLFDHMKLDNVCILVIENELRLK